MSIGAQRNLFEARLQLLGLVGRIEEWRGEEGVSLECERKAFTRCLVIP